MCYAGTVTEIPRRLGPVCRFENPAKSVVPSFKKQAKARRAGLTFARVVWGLQPGPFNPRWVPWQLLMVVVLGPMAGPAPCRRWVPAGVAGGGGGLHEAQGAQGMTEGAIIDAGQCLQLVEADVSRKKVTFSFCRVARRNCTSARSQNRT